MTTTHPSVVIYGLHQSQHPKVTTTVTAELTIVKLTNPSRPPVKDDDDEPSQYPQPPVLMMTTRPQRQWLP